MLPFQRYFVFIPDYCKKQGGYVDESLLKYLELHLFCFAVDMANVKTDKLMCNSSRVSMFVFHPLLPDLITCMEPSPVTIEDVDV